MELHVKVTDCPSIIEVEDAVRDAVAAGGLEKIFGGTTAVGAVWKVDQFLSTVEGHSYVRMQLGWVQLGWDGLGGHGMDVEGYGMLCKLNLMHTLCSLTSCIHVPGAFTFGGTGL